VFETLQNHKYVWIKKVLKDDNLKGSQMCIVTGPRIDMAVGLIARLKSLFTDNVPVSGAP
jgi:late competence protein required for DNA uptake (superfamily II DNA/RNA helicase)